MNARTGWRRGWIGIGLVAAVVAAASAQAQSTVYWDIDGATPGAGGPTPSGTWSAVDTNWSPNAAGDAATTGWPDGQFAVFSAGNDATGSFNVTVVGSNTVSGIDVRQGTVNLVGTGSTNNSLVLGSGTLTVFNGAKLTVNSFFRLSQTTGGLVVLDGGALENTSAGTGGTFIQPWVVGGVLQPSGDGIMATANSGTLVYSGTGATIYRGNLLGQGGSTSAGAQTFFKMGQGEFRFEGPNTANSTFEKLVVKEGLYRLGAGVAGTAETGFGAMPVGELPDAITLDGGAIGASTAISTDVFRGITLGSNGGVINVTSAVLTLNGPITGPGVLRVIGRQGVTITGVNTATGGMMIGSDVTMVGGVTGTTAGQLTVNGDLNLGAVPTVVDPTNIRLGTATASGTLSVAADGAIDANRGITVGAAGGTINTTKTVTYGGVIAGTGTFTKAGLGGTLILTGSNTFTGGLATFGGGFVEVSSDANLGAVPATLKPDAIALANSGSSGRMRFTESFTMPATRGITINVGGTLGGYFEVAADKTLTIAGPVTGGGQLRKTGSGALVLSGSSSYAGTTTVSSGTLRVEGVVTGTAGVSVISGATLAIANGNALATRPVTPSSGAKVTLAPYLETTVGGLAATAGGLTDVTNGKVTVVAGLSATDLVTALLAGRNGGTWDGTTGITSSVTAAQVAASELRAVGWLDNGDGSLTTGYAAPGDTNLDWVVDILDVSNFVAAGKYGTIDPATWAEGDFNYDGVVDIQDVADFSATGLYGGASYNAANTSAVAAVPEPAGLAGAIAAAVVAGCGLRRRRGGCGR